MNDVGYIPKYFTTQELVAPEFYNLLTEGALSYFHPHVLRMLDSFRKSYGSPLVINNYAIGGNYSESGLRCLKTSTGASKSKHKIGNAFDLKAENMNSLRAFINERAEDFFISRVENFDKTPTWCHVEFSTELVDKTYYFNP